MVAARKAEETAAAATTAAGGLWGGMCEARVCMLCVCVLGYVDGRLLTRGASGEAPVLKDMVVVSQWGSYRVVGGRFQ